MEPDNNSLEQRLAQHLGATAEGIEPPSGGPGDVIGIANRRRRNRRTFGSSLAAIALIATGIGAYQLSDNDSSVDIAADVGGDEEAAVDEDSNEDETVGATTSGNSDPTILPASTGPVLEWTEVDAPEGWFGGTVFWTGTSFVALVHGETGSDLITSTDGREWSSATTPAGYEIWGLQGSGQSVVAWGSEAYDLGDSPTEPFDEPEVAVFLSPDGGNNWEMLAEVPTGTEQETSSPYLSSYGSVGGAAVLGDTVVVGVSQHLQFDIEQIVEDFDVPVSNEEGQFAGWGTSDNAISICLDDFCNDEFTITYDELGLSQAEAEGVYRGSGETTVYRSVDGGPWERGDLSGSGGYTDAILAVGDEFKMCVMGEEEGSSLYSSPDGLSWTLISSGNQMGGLTTDGTNLYAQRWDMESGIVRSIDGGRSWEPVLTGVPSAHDVAGGVSGLVASGQLYDEAAYEGPNFPISIEKDGYVVTWLENGLTVADAATGEIILSFGEEDMDSQEAPDTVIEEESDDGSFALTFLDPETLEPLVTLNEEDMNTAFDMGSDDFSGEYEEPEFFLGWSGDGGDTWGWQTSTEAFGINGWAQIAVGDGIVVAMVEEFQEYDEPAAEFDETDESTDAVAVDEVYPSSSRIFIATIE